MEVISFKKKKNEQDKSQEEGHFSVTIEYICDIYGFHGFVSC